MSDITRPNHLSRKPVAAAVLGGVLAVSSSAVLAADVTAVNPPAAERPVLMLAACNPCNPCAAKKACNPCNPCAAKKAACNPCNPCAAKKATNPCNPCAAKNPCKTS